MVVYEFACTVVSEQKPKALEREASIQDVQDVLSYHFSYILKDSMFRSSEKVYYEDANKRHAF